MTPAGPPPPTEPPGGDPGGHGSAGPAEGGPAGERRLRRAGAAALTLLLYLLLLDAAVETVLGGSPVRWWIAGGVAIYLGGSAVLWRRWPARWRSVPWRTKATASFLVLLGLLASTAWLPGGLSNGIVALGQSTSVLFHLMTLAGIVVAGASLGRLSSLPAVARAGIVLLAAYAASAFVIGIVGGVAYVDLLNGRGAPSALPFWLRGAGISVLVLLPCGAAAPLVERLARGSTGAVARRLPSTLALILVLAAGVAGIRERAEAGRAGTVPAPDASPARTVSTWEDEGTDLRAEEALDRESARDSLRARLERLRDLSARLERPATTPAEVGRLLGFDPHAVHAFVRRAVRYEPYRGVLRGAEGALASGGGNSFDLVLLMAAALADRYGSSGLRMAVGELSPEQSAALVRRAAAAPPARPAVAARGTAPAGVPVGDGAPASAGEGQAPDAAVAGTASRDGLDVVPGEGEGLARRAGAVREALEAARSNRRQIAPLLRSAREIEERPAAEDAARRHAWLQVRGEDGWTTFDPAGTLPLPDSVEIVGLHEEALGELLHVVTVRVEVERAGSGGLERETAVEGSWPTAVLGERGLELAVSPAGFSVAELLEPGRSGRILDHAEDFDRFTVLLGRGGEEPGAAATLRLDGTVTEGSGGPLGGGGFDVDVFDRLPGPRDESGGERDGVDLTALWLTVELDGPGGATTRIERPLLDRLGPAARRSDRLRPPGPTEDRPRIAVRLVQRHQLLFPVGRIGFERIARDALRGVTERSLERAVALRHGEVPATSDDAFDDLELPMLPADLVRVSDNALSLTEAHLAGEGIAFLAGPNVYLRSEGLRADADGGILRRVVVDLARNRVRTLGDPAAAAEARLLHGLWASELEGRALDGGEGASATSYAAGVLRAAGREGVEMRIVRRPADVEPLRADADAKATMSSEVGAGNLLLAPARPVRVAGRERTAWWRLDREGHLLAVGPRGRGQASSEGMMVLEHVSKPMVKRTMHFVACLNRRVAGGGAVGDAAGECMAEWLVDVVKYSLDQAIEHFITGPLEADVDEARAEMLGEEYERLYQNARKAWEAYNTAREASEDPTVVLPGPVQEGIEAGEEAADAGAEIGGIMGFRIYLLLTMGDEIAEYASRL